MDDIEDDARYPPETYGRSQGYSSSQHQKLPVRNASYPPRIGYVEDDNEEEDDEVEEEHDNDNNEINGFVQIVNYEDEDDGNDGDGNDEDEDDLDSRRHQKKRKLKSLLSSYEFAPRVTTASEAAAPAPIPKPSFGGRNLLADWSERETFILLNAWGDRFLQHGRKSLRSDEWQEVAKKVSHESKRERTDTQCRNRLDTLKKKYKKEKMKFPGAGYISLPSKWLYFQKMDMLLSASPHPAGVPCGVDLGDSVSSNPKEYQNHPNGSNEMRDDLVNLNPIGDKRDDSDGLPPKKPRNRTQGGNGAYFRLLADSILKFSEIYEKTEKNKRQQMLELEKMRMDFHRDIELQNRQIVERAQEEIAKIRQGYDEENEVSAENVSG